MVYQQGGLLGQAADNMLQEAARAYKAEGVLIKQNNEIPTQLSVLREELASLTKSLEDLKQRLKPVMRNRESAEVSSSPAGEKLPITPLGGELQGMRQLVTQCNKTASSILGDLEL